MDVLLFLSIRREYNTSSFIIHTSTLSFKSPRLLDLARLDALGADPHGFRLAVNGGLHRLQIGKPPALAQIMGMADVVPNAWPFSAYIAYLGHDDAPSAKEPIITGFRLTRKPGIALIRGNISSARRMPWLETLLRLRPPVGRVTAKSVVWLRSGLLIRGGASARKLFSSTAVGYCLKGR
jgi:hypothetical protein